MSEPSPTSPLREQALTYLTDQYLKVCTQPLDPKQVEFKVEPEYSRLLIISRAYTEDNEVGAFRGQFSIGYKKADLDKVLPAPLEVVGEYPIRYRELAAYLKERYNVIIEDNEFSLVTLIGTPVPIVGDTLLEQPPEEDGDILYLSALPTSILWKTGSRLMLRIVKVGSQQSLASAVAQTGPGDLQRLLDFRL